MEFYARFCNFIDSEIGAYWFTGFMILVLVSVIALEKITKDEDEL